MPPQDSRKKTNRKTSSIVIFFLAFTALLFGMHLPYLSLPYFWDELGQYIPASLDIFQFGAWIPRTAMPNVHPPAVMAYLALVWKIFGYSIPAARAAMLVVAAFGLLFSFLLAIRLSRKTAGAPAFAAIIFLIATPLFYTQSMMAQLDMPAMTFTALALLLFLDDRWAACAAACTVLVLVKETGISTPLVFGAWLWIRDRKRREALYFLAPAIALGLWLLALHQATGHWLGNPEFARYNVADSVEPLHIFGTVYRRLYILFIADGLFIGTIALWIGRRVLRGREWNLAFTVAGAQLVLVTIFGGASLDRYVLPVFPVLYAAMAAAGSVYRPRWRWITQAAMTGTLALGWVWNPPYPFALENNLSMVDFVSLQQKAANYVEDYAKGKRVASAWPFTDAIKRPEYGYVQRPIPITRAADFTPESLAELRTVDLDMLVVFSRTWEPKGGALDYKWVRDYLRDHWNYRPQATSEEIRAGLGFVPVVRWERGGQWIEIYVPGRQP